MAYTYGTMGHPLSCMPSKSAGSISSLKNGPITGPALSGWVVIRVMV